MDIRIIQDNSDHFSNVEFFKGSSYDHPGPPEATYVSDNLDLITVILISNILS